MPQPSNPSNDPRLLTFFNTVAEAARAEPLPLHPSEEKRKTEERERLRRLKETIDQELGGILRTLVALPAKDGKKFFVDVQDFVMVTRGMVYGAVSVSYEAETAPKTRPDIEIRNAINPSPQAKPGVKIIFFGRQGKPLDMQVTQLSMLNSKMCFPPYEAKTLANFDEVRREIARGVASFAPERIADIGIAVGATPAPASATTAAKPGQLVL